ncbi:fungal-specific transcription factor domain-containing protein [Leptodontidium sp. MPI-SDFR-AT-0119]|nr:fungal-specific transcription factor domain-containing protein [Leptodontidium sp. MPI-SDFR-AT-0119]
MDREERLPTRVSKACDRCKSQKKRCDLARPCRHCVRAQIECKTQTLETVKKARARRQTETPIPTSYLPLPDHQRQQSHHASESLTDAVDNRQDGMHWNARAVSSASDNQTPRASQAQLQHENSSIPEFQADSALAMARKIFGSQKSQAFKDRATSAIPGGGCRDTTGTNSSNIFPAPLIPVLGIIGIELPGQDVCNKLLETYFASVHWFSLVVYEPKFRGRYTAVVGSGLASRSDRGFLLLLLMVLIMGCWYTPNTTRNLGLPPQEMDGLRNRLLAVVQRDFMELMDEDSLEFVQVCALLGSFYLYHGKPRSSFSILGAATKTSQAMDLHRDSSARRSFEDVEERKRVWWTIYTWDRHEVTLRIYQLSANLVFRFATITYGRPLGINAKDCNVTMPSEIIENIHFDPSFPPAMVCLSTYQYHLNHVYRIVSPILEDIYGMRTSSNLDSSSELPKMVSTANRALLEWHQDLPPQLSFDHLSDLTADSSAEQKMHALQALSLQLTYDNLLIVIHRPLLAGQGQGDRPSDVSGTSPASQFSDDVREIGLKRCLGSALRISNLQRKQNLFVLARSSHLVSFMGMNLFTASVVLFICALSDTLSDTAQEAKRGLKRTLQMQKALSNHASLSLQCSMILEDLVQLILKREMEEMLRDDSVGIGGISSEVAPDGAENGMEGVQPEGNGSQSEGHPGAYSTALGAGSGCVPNPESSHFTQSLLTLQRGMSAGMRTLELGTLTICSFPRQQRHATLG